jgi:activator of HSP90 ATPase
MMLNQVQSRVALETVRTGKSGGSMIDRTMPIALTPTRRQMLTGLVIACCSQNINPSLWGQNQKSAMKKVPSTATNKTRTSLHQEIEYKASRQRIYEALLSSKDFATFSGAPAEIDPKAGGAFSMFGGMIVGRNVELILNQRIVQAWRPTADFPEGTYSLVKIELHPQDSGTKLTLDHTGFPEGHFDHLDAGWHSHYWEPLRKFLA